MYEILLTRIFSVTMLYHFAFVALSLAMFGMTAGALLVYLAPALFPADRVHHRLAMAAVAFPIALVLSFLTQLSIPFQPQASVVAVYALTFTYVVISVPFVLSGIAVCLALTAFPRSVSRLYAADLAGAALGCIALIAVLDWSDGPTAVLWIAAFAAAGGLAFASAAGSVRLRGAAAAVLIALTLAAVLHTRLVWKGTPVLRILYTKSAPGIEPAPLYDKWNSYSRVRVTGNPEWLSSPVGWGLSQTTPRGKRLHQLLLDIDVWAGTTMTRFDGDLAKVDHLKYDVTNIAHYIRPRRDVLVIGAGGGRDVLSALAFGARSVTAVEINRNIIRTVNGRYGEFTGHLDRQPGVRFVNDEARSFVARSPDRFGMIQISLIDTWAATAAGAFVLGENSLYTVEAWTTFLEHLAPDGMLSVSRWYFKSRPAELYRTTTLAVEALRAVGVTDPRRHLAIVANLHPLTYSSAGDVPEGVGTMIVSRNPFSDAELEVLEREAARLQFDVPFTPRSAADDTFVRLTDPAQSAAFVGSYPINISAPTDDSPFFFNMLRLRDITSLSLLNLGSLSHNMIAVATLGILLLTVAAMTALCILLPLWMTRRRADLSGTWPLLGYFIAIGLGFMLIETSQMQRLIITLGHPSYGLSVVLFAMLLSSGLGSFLSGSAADAGAAGRRRLVLLVVVLMAFGLATPAVARWSQAATTPVRIATAVALLFPAGIFMGMAFPIGMRLAAARAGSLTPWLWGLNGAASVLASVLGICIALTWSISTAFWAGWVAYVCAAGMFSVAARVNSHLQTSNATR